MIILMIESTRQRAIATTVASRLMTPTNFSTAFEADHTDSRIAMDCADRNRKTPQPGD